MSFDLETLRHTLAQLPTKYWFLLACGAYVVLYLYRRTLSMTGTPPEALKLSPQRWTQQEILDAYETVKRNPIDVTKSLPPKTGRRYIVVGGSGKRITHIICFFTSELFG